MAKSSIMDVLASRAASSEHDTSGDESDAAYQAMFGINTAGSAPWQLKKVSGSKYAIVRFELMDDFPGHPFRLYEGEREADMIDSIREKGILQPMLLSASSDGRYQILSGHNRKYCGMKAGLLESPAIIKQNLSDDDALMYVIETNLMQRSFSDMAHSEKAAIIAAQHSKLFSQGKRNDIIAELKMLENPHEHRDNDTLRHVGEKTHSDELVGAMYGLSSREISRYIRINKLLPTLKTRLDNGEIAFIPAVTLSFIHEEQQEQLNYCLELTGFKVDMTKANILREYSEKGKLDPESIACILSGELRQKPKTNRTPTVKIGKSVYARYFKPEQTAADVQKIVEAALAYYFGNRQ